MTLVPEPTLGPNGIVVPPQTGTGSILGDATTGVLGDLNAAFGGNLNVLNLQTPQGQLASSLTAYIAAKNALFAYFTSQVDPQYAEGFMQDAIAAIFNLTRLPATYTEVTCTCAGSAGTVIALGAQAQDTAGNVFSAMTSGTIGGGGTVSIVFTSLNPGPVTCAHGTLTRIMSTTPGWDSITNPGGTDTLPETLGRAIESSSAFELRRQQSLAINAQSATDSILGAVLGCDPNVVDAYVKDNPSGSAEIFGGMVLTPHSVYVAVQGPLASIGSIANAIWSKKPVGCAYSDSAEVLGTISGATLTVGSVAYGNLQVGQTITASGLPTGTITIATLGSGSGGAGSYGLNQTVGTVTVGTMTLATQYTVEDTQVAAPHPTYDVKWTTPEVVELPITVTMPESSRYLLPADYATLISSAIAGAFLGTDGGTPARIGATLYGTRFYSPILTVVPLAQLVSVLFNGTDTTYALQINQYATPGTITCAFV